MELGKLGFCVCAFHGVYNHTQRERERSRAVCRWMCVCERKKQLWRVSHFLKCVSMLEFGVFVSVSV